MRRLLTPRWLAWHALALAAVAVCLALGWWQFQRASGGNRLSWAYTFQWPIFAGFVVLVWAHAARDELRASIGGRPRSDPPPPITKPPPIARPAARRPVVTSPPDVDDPELTAYNRYLAWLNANPDRRRDEYPG